MFRNYHNTTCLYLYSQKLDVSLFVLDINILRNSEWTWEPPYFVISSLLLMDFAIDLSGDFIWRLEHRTNKAIEEEYVNIKKRFTLFFFFFSL